MEIAKLLDVDQATLADVLCRKGTKVVEEELGVVMVRTVLEDANIRLICCTFRHKLTGTQSPKLSTVICSMMFWKN